MDSADIAAARKLIEAATPGKPRCDYLPPGPCGQGHYEQAIYVENEYMERIHLAAQPFTTKKNWDQVIKDGKFFASAREGWLKSLNALESAYIQMQDLEEIIASYKEQFREQAAELKFAREKIYDLTAKLEDIEVEKARMRK